MPKHAKKIEKKLKGAVGELLLLTDSFAILSMLFPFHYGLVFSHCGFRLFSSWFRHFRANLKPFSIFFVAFPLVILALPGCCGFVAVKTITRSLVELLLDSEKDVSRLVFSPLS